MPVVITLAGTATDDGLPVPPGALIHAWQQTSGPEGKVLFSDETILTPTASFFEPGTYELQLTTTDNELSTEAVIEIVIQRPTFQSVAFVRRRG